MRRDHGDIEIERGWPAGRQEATFMNATLQETPSGELTFSVATYVKVPPYICDEEALEAYLRTVLHADRWVTFDVKLGPSGQ